MTYEGQPFPEVIRPISLYENDLVDNSELPVILSPGESREIDIWLKINVGSLTAKAVTQCQKNQKKLETYSDYDVCFHNNGFSIANHVYVEPYVTYMEGTYNGVGVQFITNENMTATFEVSALRASMIATRGKLAKNYNEETF